MPNRASLPTLLLAAFVAVLVYVPSLSGSFLLDDYSNIVPNQALLRFEPTVEHLRLIMLSSGSSSLGRPVAMLTFGLNSAFMTTLSPLPFKVVNLVIHLMIFALVYRILSQLLRVGGKNTADQGFARWFVIFAACLWLLSPLNLSTAAYVVQRMTQLSSLFVLAGLTYYLSVRSVLAKQHFDWRRFFPVVTWLLFFTTLAVLSKENGILLIPLVAAVEVSVFRGLFLGVANNRLLSCAWIIALAPLLSVALLIILRPEFVVSGYVGRDFSLEERLLTQPLVVWQYAQNFLIPDLQYMTLLHDDIELVATKSDLRFWLPVGIWIALAALTFRSRRRSPLMFLGVFIFFIGHSIESTVFALEIAYEHRNYLPSVGLCIFLLGALCFVQGFLSKGIISALMALVIIVSGGSLLMRSLNWSDPIRLYSHWTQYHPQSYRSYVGLGASFYREFGDSRVFESGDEAAQIAKLERVRNVLIRAHEIDPLAAGALVQLAIIDLNHFTQSPTGLAWLEKLETSVQDWKSPHAEDVANLKILVNFAKRPACLLDCKRGIGSLVDVVALKFPESHRVAQHVYAMDLILRNESDVAASLDRLVKRGDVENAYLWRMERFILEGEYGSALMQSKNWLDSDSERTTIEAQVEMLKLLDRVKDIRRQPVSALRL